MGILITGANGLTGHAILNQLRGKAKVIRCLTSNKKSTDLLHQMGATEVVEGNLADEESIYQAARGMTRVFHIPPRMKPDEVQFGKNVINAVKRAGVKCIYLHSVINSQMLLSCAPRSIGSLNIFNPAKWKRSGSPSPTHNFGGAN